MPCFVKQSATSCVSPNHPTGRRISLTLEDLEVLEVRILGIHVELHSGHGNIEVDTVEDLAECGTIFQGSVIRLGGGHGGVERGDEKARRTQFRIARLW